MFAPTKSIVRKTFCKQVPQLWTCLPRVAACWSAKIVKLNEHDYEIFALTFSPDGQVVASGSNDGTVRLWNAITGEQMQKLEGDVGVVHKVVFSPEGQVLASVSEDATVRLWNTTTGEQTQKLEGHDSRINAVAFSPDGQVFASGSIDGTLWLWNVITGERMQKLEGHSGVILELVFSRDGQVVASGSHDAAVRLWNATTGKLTKKLEGHRHWILRVAFSPDGQAVASASADRTVRLWDATTGEQTQKLEGHRKAIGAVAFSSDGQTVASASLDGTVRVWNTVTGEVIQLISVVRPVDQMTFSVDMRALQTNAGNYLLEAAVAGFPTDTSARTTSLELRGQWIRDRGDDLLWLPYEFGTLYFIMHGQALAIRQYSGDVKSMYKLVTDVVPLPESCSVLTHLELWTAFMKRLWLTRLLGLVDGCSLVVDRRLSNIRVLNLLLDRPPSTCIMLQAYARSIALSMLVMLQQLNRMSDRE
nr:vegetative incompatibility protein het-e-1 [Quercus suber]